MNNKSLISVVIPTLNSSNHLETLLRSIKRQAYKKIEIIIADNYSVDNTLEIGRKYGAKIVLVSGKPPQVAKQRNLGARAAKGEYLYFMDHDMELSDNFFVHFSKIILNKSSKDIDAWYIPERIISKSKILSIARNFEEKFINGTVVSAARLIKRKRFYLTKGFDEKLSFGPADWDLDIQLKLKKLKFAIFDKFVYHHEENLTTWSYIFKKTTYIKGEEIYKNKWVKNRQIYRDVVVKQYSLRYRILIIFLEDGKWKKLIKRLHEYLLFLIIKLLIVTVYVFCRRRYAK